MKFLLLLIFSFCLTFGNFAQDNTLVTVDEPGITAFIKLTKAEPTPDCGVVAWVAAQKFELLNAGYSFIPKKHIIVLQQCPEFLGRDFFVEGKSYKSILVPATNQQIASSARFQSNEVLTVYSCIHIRPL